MLLNSRTRRLSLLGRMAIYEVHNNYRKFPNCTCELCLGPKNQGGTLRAPRPFGLIKPKHVKGGWFVFWWRWWGEVYYLRVILFNLRNP